MKKCCAALLALLMLLPCLALAEGDGELDFLVLVYLCGTDLESGGGAASSDLGEMLDAGLQDDGKLAVLIQTGGTAEWKDERIDPSTAQRFLITDDLYPASDDLGQLDMGDVETLRDFVRFAVEEYPAERYGLVLWDHGGGSTGGVCYDEHTERSLGIEAIHSALSEADAHFEFIGFDACLMSTIEMASAIAPFANYMVASEELEPGWGWAYDKWLGALREDVDMDGADIGRAIVDSFIDTSLQLNPNDYVTLSVTDLSQMDGMAEAASAFGELLSESLAEDGFAPIARARAGMRSFGEFVDMGSDMLDLAAVAKAFEQIAPDGAEALQDGIDKAVVYSRNSANVGDACGLSILMPLKTKAYVDQYMPTYDALSLIPGYSSFMNEYVSQLTGGEHHFSVPAIEAQPIDTSDEATSGWLSALIAGTQQAGREDVPLSGDDLSQVAAAFGDEAYTLKLSKDDLESLSYVEASLMQDALDEVGDQYGEDVYFDYGLMQDTYVDWDSGTVYGLFDGNWPTLEGQMVAMYDQIVTEHYARSVIPASVNGEEMYLLVVFNDEHPYGLVAGYTEGYDDHGNPARGYEKLKSGDVVAPMYDLIYWDDQEEMQVEPYEGESITVGDGLLTFGYEAVEPALYSYAFCLNDVYGGYEFTDFWDLNYTEEDAES